MNELLTAPLQKPFCLFLVGMQCRSWKSMWKLPIIGKKMGQMQKELQMNPDSGLIWGTNFMSFTPLTTLFLSYWKSSEDIHRFVNDKKFSHLSASKDYFKRFAKDPNLGVWHETYEIDPTRSENLYLSMAPFGAMAFTSTEKLTQQNRTFSQRLRREYI